MQGWKIRRFSASSAELSGCRIQADACIRLYECRHSASEANEKRRRCFESADEESRAGGCHLKRMKEAILSAEKEKTIRTKNQEKENLKCQY